MLTSLAWSSMQQGPEELSVSTLGVLGSKLPGIHQSRSRVRPRKGFLAVDPEYPALASPKAPADTPY